MKRIAHCCAFSSTFSNDFRHGLISDRTTNLPESNHHHFSDDDPAQCEDAAVSISSLCLELWMQAYIYLFTIWSSNAEFVWKWMEYSIIYSCISLKEQLRCYPVRYISQNGTRMVAEGVSASASRRSWVWFPDGTWGLSVWSFHVPPCLYRFSTSPNMCVSGLSTVAARTIAAAQDKSSTWQM